MYVACVTNELSFPTAVTLTQVAGELLWSQNARFSCNFLSISVLQLASDGSNPFEAWLLFFQILFPAAAWHGARTREPTGSAVPRRGHRRPRVHKPHPWPHQHHHRVSIADGRIWAVTGDAGALALVASLARVMRGGSSLETRIDTAKMEFLVDNAGQQLEAPNGPSCWPRW
jgi:hypothetical protein